MYVQDPTLIQRILMYVEDPSIILESLMNVQGPTHSGSWGREGGFGLKPSTGRFSRLRGLRDYPETLNP